MEHGGWSVISEVNLFDAINTFQLSDQIEQIPVGIFL